MTTPSGLMARAVLDAVRAAAAVTQPDFVLAPPAPQEPTVTDRTPAETLTAAAEKLRHRIAQEQIPVVRQKSFDLFGKEIRDPAAMHPGVGAALADWLTEAARSHAALAPAAASVWRRAEQVEERDAWVADQTDQAALAVALQILGEASQ